jgi:hypothetical protein
MGSGLFNRGAPKHPGILLRQYAQEYSPKRVSRLPSLETWKRIVKSDPHWAKLRETIDIKLDVESLINQANVFTPADAIETADTLTFAGTRTVVPSVTAPERSRLGVGRKQSGGRLNHSSCASDEVKETSHWIV